VSLVLALPGRAADRRHARADPVGTLRRVGVGLTGRRRTGPTLQPRRLPAAPPRAPRLGAAG
jgi:hypothetical protein